MIKKILFFTLLLATSPLFAEENWRSSVVEAAYSLVITDKTEFNGVQYNRDCSGTVYTAFAQAGFPLQALLNHYGQTGLGGSQTLALIVEFNGSLAKLETLQKGDLIFFDNTFDRNLNGKSDDSITHVVIVTAVNTLTGDVTFVHYNTFMDKIVEQQLNLKEQANPDKNIILRWPQKNDPQQQKYAGELVNRMGSPF
jgi:hypothetical protein